MSEAAKLREDHAKLVRMFGELGKIIERPAPPSQLELFDFRRNLQSTLIAHLKLEDWALYPRLIESGDADACAKGKSFKEEMGGLAPAFVAYCEKWTASTIAADWPAYCSDTRGLIDALMDRITRENRELIPLLEKISKAA